MKRKIPDFDRCESEEPVESEELPLLVICLRFEPVKFGIGGKDRLESRIGSQLDQIGVGESVLFHGQLAEYV